jgi:hypothetical protein
MSAIPPPVLVNATFLHKDVQYTRFNNLFKDTLESGKTYKLFVIGLKQHEHNPGLYQLENFVGLNFDGTPHRTLRLPQALNRAYVVASYQ